MKFFNIILKSEESMKSKLCLVFLACICMCMQGCIKVRICEETKRSFKQSYQYSNLSAVTVAEFRSILDADTATKAIIWFSPCCVDEAQKMFLQISEKWNDMPVYLLADHTASLQDVAEMQQNLSVPVYFLRDSSYLFATSAFRDYESYEPSRFHNICTLLFQNGILVDTPPIRDVVCMIVSQDGYAKVAEYVMVNRAGHEHRVLAPMDAEFFQQPIENVDFLSREVVVLDSNYQGWIYQNYFLPYTE